MQYFIRIFMFILILPSIFSFLLAQSKYDKNILIIHSYHQNFEWTRNLNRGLIDELKPEQNNYFIQIEYLDFKRYQKKEIFSSLFNLMKIKFAGLQFDIVITSDDAALEFIKEYNIDYFENMPKVFCGVNYFEKSMISDLKNVTGIAEKNDISSTLKLMNRIHPDKKDLYVISDTTLTTRNVLKVFNDAINNSNYGYNIKILLSKSNSELIKIFKTIDKKGAIALAIGYFLDEEGRLDSYSSRLENLSENTEIPIYAVWDIYLNHGIIGGRLTDSYDQGKAAGNLANYILSGNNADEIEVIQNIGNHYKFDYKYLAKFDISENSLPEESIIINKPDDSLIVDIKTIIIVSVIFVLLLLSIALLIFYSFNKRKAERNLLKAKEAAETANRLKSEFLAQMSHEIRTPVNTILSFSSLIKSNLIHKIDEDLKNCFSSIENGGKRLIRTIDLIIKMAEVQSGGIEINKESVNFYRDVLIPVVDEFRTLADKKNLSIKVKNNSSSECRNFIDVHTMKQIIVNLLDNAIKYTFEGEIEISFNQFDNSCKLEINDTGIGISEKYLKQIFEPFTQEEQGYTRKYEGNGLGMALVKKYCELNGVDISVESEKGKGTKVTLMVYQEKSSEYAVNL